MISWENNEDYYPNEFRFIIDEENRSIEFYGKNARQGIYEYDLDWDHGSYTSINETKCLQKLNCTAWFKLKFKEF